MDCSIAMLHVLSLVIFVTSCEQFIGGRYAGPGRAGEWAEKGMRSLSWSAHLDTGESSHQSHPSVWAELGQSQATTRITTITSTSDTGLQPGPGHSELRLSLNGKMEKVKSAEVPLD